MPNPGHQGVKLAVRGGASPLGQPFVIGIVVGFNNIQNHRVARISFHKPSGDYPVMFGPVAWSRTAFGVFEGIMCQGNEP